MDLRVALITGIDIPIVECRLIAHQPTIEEIAFIGETEFFTAIQTLCISKKMITEEGKDDSFNVDNFQIFMTVIQDKNMVDKKNAVKQLLTIVFPNYKVMFTPRSMIFNNGEDNITIDNENFEILQEYLKTIFCAKESSSSGFNPRDAKAREIAKKLMRGRERVAQEKGETNTSVFSLYISILSIGLHIPITEFKKYTMYQLYDSIERFNLNINWEMDARMRLAGGKPDSQPDNWMKNIH